MDIVSFAEQFLGKLDKLPSKYSLDYNAPQKQADTAGTAAPGASRRAAVRIAEVTLKDLRGCAAVRTKLSRTEPTLAKLRNEASQMLSCPVDSVSMVQQGRLLRDEHAEEVATLAPSAPVYVFDSREWRQKGLYSAAFKTDLINLLKRYNTPSPDSLASQFIASLPQWSK